MPRFEADAGGGSGSESGSEEGKGSEDPKDDKGSKEDKGKPGTEDKDKKGKEEKTFTQEQVNKMMAKEKNQGKTSVLSELGIDPKDTKALASIKAFIESQKTDEEKETEKTKAGEARLQEAEIRAVQAEAKVEAMRLGVQPKYVEDVITLAMAKLDDNAELKDIISEFKTRYPSWFGEDSEDDKEKNAGKRGTGTSLKSDSGKKDKPEGKSLGQRLAASRKSQGKNSSYWGRNK
jgi:hypothetical protein